MLRFTGELQPGDVICTRSNGIVGKLIRFGAALLGRSNLVNHVIIVHHFDASGTLWGLEGRAGGVGWIDMTDKVDRFSNANTAQPKTTEQRKRIAELSGQLLGTPYDWEAIVVSAMAALRINKLWRSREYKGGVPGHVICSAFADWVYEEVGLASPGKNGVTRYTTPADWDEFIMEGNW